MFLDLVMSLALLLASAFFSTSCVLGDPRTGDDERQRIAVRLLSEFVMLDNVQIPMLLRLIPVFVRPLLMPEHLTRKRRSRPLLRQYAATSKKRGGHWQPQDRQCWVHWHWQPQDRQWEESTKRGLK